VTIEHLGRDWQLLDTLARLNAAGLEPTLARLAVGAGMNDAEADLALEELRVNALVRSRTVVTTDNPLAGGPQVRYEITVEGRRELDRR
jgi:hypothetical protein